MKRKMLKRNWVAYFIVSLLTIILPVTLVWAEEPNEPNSCGCCKVDKPGEGPPASSSSTGPLRIATTSASSNTKIFRTDSGPEMDWYQPCNGGDNEIHFNINVNDVEISSITSATLTLAVWDVDYDCGSACSGYCERDTVYVNGHRLTTPVAYLTGANNQWSTVTFNVDPSWIVDGDNYIQIFIDTLGHGCWCVTCDWGELRLEVSEVEVGVTEIHALNDTDISSGAGIAITDPIWTDDEPSQYDPIADAMRDSFLLWSWPGTIEIKTVLDVKTPPKPSWTPKCKYAWWISGTTKANTGEFTGWDGQFTIEMPQKVGKYNLTLQYDIYDNLNNKINSQNMTHTLYVTHSQSILSKPKTSWLNKACNWGSGATNPTEVVTYMNNGIYHNSGWNYTYPNANWDELVEGSDTKGDCVSFAQVWSNLSKCLGIEASLPSFYKGKKGKGLVTISPATALDGNPGNAYPQGGSLASANRWRFAGHQVGQYGGLFSKKYYDPTTGNIYNTYNAYVEWDLEPQDSNTPYQVGRKGTEYVKVYYRVGPYPWGAFEYFGPYISSGSSGLLTISSLPSVFLTQSTSGRASFTGTHTQSGVDLDENGKYDYLSVEADIDVNSSGEYGIYGTLFFNGEEITSRPSVTSAIPTYYYLSAVPGIHKATLQFSGQDIYESGKSGNYTVEMKLMDNSGTIIDTLSFDTSNYLYTEFREIPAELASSVDEGNDVDGDGLYEYLIAKISVDVSKAMNYLIEGSLETTDGNIIDTTSKEVFLDNTGTVEIMFDGRKIRRLEQNGPYVLSITLTDENHSQIDWQTFNTSTYSYIDFESPIAQFTGDYTDSGADVDGDSLFDYLILETKVNAVEDGNYSIVGILADDIGTEIAVSQIEMPFAAGTNQVTLKFDGVEIHRHGKDGPYVLKNLVLYDSEGNTVDAASDAYLTSPYSHMDFEAPASAFKHTFTDYGLDTNGDGYFEFLSNGVDINVAEAGNYILRAALYDKNGVEIVLTSTDSYLNPGDQSMQLRFDGFSIYKHRVNGPYILNYVILCTDNSEFMDAQADAYTTSAYNYTQFQRPPVVLTGNYSDHAVDIDSDGVYEYLTVDVEVIVTNAGNYALNARLMDKNEDEIVWASTTKWLVADQVQTMQLNFNGPSIYNHGVNGPYYVRDVYVYNMSNTGLSDYIYDAYVTQNHWQVANEPPVANAGPDQTVERTSVAGAQVQLDGSDSNDPDGDSLTYEWTWAGGSASGVKPVITLPMGLTTVTLTVSDGKLTDTDTVDITVVDTTGPTVNVVEPKANLAVQDGQMLRATASDLSGVDKVYFCVREADGGNGIPIGKEDMPGTFNSSSDKWECNFDTTQLQDGYYVVLAKGVDTYGNEGWSEVVPFSIRNWAIITMLPSTPNSKVGRTMPVKFSLRIAKSVDPAMPFVYNDELEIRIYDKAKPSIILQRSVFGSSSTDYRIDMIAKMYMTNFKTKTTPATYVVEVWRPAKNFKVGSFTFNTVK